MKRRLISIASGQVLNEALITKTIRENSNRAVQEFLFYHLLNQVTLLQISRAQFFFSVIGRDKLTKYGYPEDGRDGRCPPKTLTSPKPI